MGEPEDPEQFVRFQAADLTIYVAPRLLERLDAGARRMPFYITGYGRFWLTFAQPWEKA